MARHFGMDWLRIGAFALLILYHVGMVFVPWGFHIKTAQPLVWAEIPMFLTNPWRLSLLFLVSGYASRAMLVRAPAIGGFVASRSGRLLLPLAFGIAVVVPPQSWVELVVQHRYPHGYAWFWARDYFRFGTFEGLILPTWNHLWFVVYLWVYTLALAALLAVIPARWRLQNLFDRVFAGSRALWLPLLYVFVFQSLLFVRDEDTHDLFNDGPAHLRYFAMFLFGFGLAGSDAVMAGLRRWWPVAAGLATAGFVTIAALLVAWPDFTFPSRAVVWVFRVARDIETWATIAALIGVAERFWNHDHRWRATLAEAVFPFYLIHQTIIVVVEYWLRPLALGAGAEFAILVAATVAGCWGFYLIGREIGWLRPLIGLKRRVARPRGDATEAAPA